MHVMLDLETLGTKPGCAIVSIGACVFDMDGVHNDAEYLRRPFYQAVDIASPLSRTLSIDPSTLSWWNVQSEEARKVFTGDKISLEQALYDFTDWLYLMNKPEMLPAERDEIYVWCHGATFDVPILNEAYDRWAVGGYTPRVHGGPIKFWNVRDTRTLYALTTINPNRTKGTHHNALDDAIAQAKAVIAGYKALGKTL